MGWPDHTAELAKFYPTTVLVTGYDILFFWVARMMMFGTFVADDAAITGDGARGPQVPFQNVFLHGLIRDEFGRKMSKSRGNGIDPLDWVQTFGADALRFTLARGASPGGDLAIGEDHARASRNFATKLFNATRFALLNGAAPAPLPAVEALTDADRWILGRLEEVRAEVDSTFDSYEFNKACESLYHFAWDEFCDWYVELAKVQLGEGISHTTAVLAAVLDTLLKLLHPVMPFVTEVLWKALTGGESVVIADWPTPSEIGIDHAAAQRVADMQKMITEVRRFRSDQGLGDRQKVPARLSEITAAGLDAHVPAVTALAWLTPPADDFTPSASVEVRLSAATVTVELDTSGTVDVAAERRRLEKDLAAAQKDLAGTTGKLGNEGFLSKAPAEVIDKIRARQQLAGEEVERITARLAALNMTEPTPDEIASLLQVEHLLDQRWPETKIEPSTARISALLELLGSPQQGYPSIHIGGTNGKTSVARIIDALLTALHRRTGRTTSPHLQSAVERIAIDNSPISPAAYVNTYREIEPFVELVDQQSQADGGPRLSKFEVVTAMAFAAFADAPIDVAVVEVGLGGRWDATNVVNAPVAVITPIGIDHVDYLGDTIAEIAGEKAGIITKQSDDLVPTDTVAVIGRQPPEAMEVLMAQAIRVDAAVAREDSEFAVLGRQVAVGGQLLELQGLGGVYTDVFLPLHGEHQAHNAVLALAAVEAFFGAGADRQLDIDAVRAGFAAVRSPGRLERMRSAPTVFLDAAHNPAGAAALAQAVGEEFDFRFLVGIVSVMADKDTDGILAALEPVLDQIVVTHNGSPRALDVTELAMKAEERFGPERVFSADTLPDAIETATALVEDAAQAGDGVGGLGGVGIVITGSVVTAGAARSLFGRDPA